MYKLCSDIDKVVEMLVITEKIAADRVLQTVRRKDVTPARVTVWAASRDIRGRSVAKVQCQIVNNRIFRVNNCIHFFAYRHPLTWSTYFLTKSNI